jgi:hypothetical protein
MSILLFIAGIGAGILLVELLCAPYLRSRNGKILSDMEVVLNLYQSKCLACDSFAEKEKLRRFYAKLLIALKSRLYLPDSESKEWARYIIDSI